MSNDIAKVLTPTEEFQEKIKERIRTAVGELMPDEALAKIVEEGVRKAFFDAQEKRNQWGERISAGDSWFITFVRNELSAKVQKAVDEWMAKNADSIKQQVNDFIGKGILGAVAMAIEQRFFQVRSDLQQSIAQALSNLAR